MRQQTQRSSVGALAVLLAACVPEFDDDLSQLRQPRILALQSEPAEAKQGAVTLTALVAMPPDAADPGTPDFALCVDRKPLTELGPVSPRCLAGIGPGNSALLPLGAGPSVQATLPADTCRLFGPLRPEPKPGEPAGRPVDPDPSGGYYQPFVSVLPGAAESALGGVRLACGIAGAVQAQIVEFNARYVANANPAPAALELVTGEGSVPVAADEPEQSAETQVVAGQRLVLRVRWPDCPRTAECGDGLCSEGESVTDCADGCSVGNGCTGAESYAWYDPLTRSVASRRESLRVSWFTSAGRFAEERTGRSEGEADVSFSDNTWQAPAAGVARIWVVLRDDRGGVGWRSYTLRAR